MRILCLMPLWNAPSELWAIRMFEMLEDHLVIICTENASPGTTWNKVPVVGFSTGPSSVLGRLTNRILAKVNLRDKKRAKQDKLKRIIREFKVEVVLIHFLNYSLEFRQILDSLSIPVYIHCHGSDVQWNMNSMRAPFKRVHKENYIQEILRLPNNVSFIANSEFTKNKLLTIGLPESRVFRKYLGVPITNLKTKDVIQEDSKLSILYLGRLVDCKGPDLVIRAFEIACEQGLKAELTMAGDGPLRVMCEILRARSDYKDFIHILGAVDPVKGEELRLGADIFTAHNCIGPITNQEEAFGVSILEAMAAELPVITGRSGALTETIVHDETGILLKPGDVTAHARALLLLGNDSELRRKLGKAGKARVGKMFSYEKEKNELFDILKI